MGWTVYLTRNAHKQLSKLPRLVQDLADLAIVDLKEQGIHPQGSNILKTDVDTYRLRLNYRYRMRYRITNERVLEIEVFYIGHRKDA